jgi:hypothetical protein
MHRLRAFPKTELLFLATVACAAAAFYTRMEAHVRWRLDEPTGRLGLLSWVWSFGALIPFLLLVWVAPNPELNEAAPRAARRGQALMYFSIAIMFALEAFLLAY